MYISNHFHRIWVCLPAFTLKTQVTFDFGVIFLATEAETRGGQEVRWKTEEEKQCQNKQRDLYHLIASDFFFLFE